MKNGMVSVSDRLTHWFNFGRNEYTPPETNIGDLADELLKITGIRSKSFSDKVEDTLESLHLKTKSPIKEAAERVAASMPNYETTDELKQKITDTVEGIQDTTTNSYDHLLKSLNLREKSTIEKAVDAYNRALHEMKVALGTEDRTTLEKLNNIFGETSRSVKDTTGHAYQWFKASVTPSTAAAPPSSFFSNARDT